MPAAKIQSDHNQLNRVAAAFRQQASVTGQMLKNLQAKLDVLRGGGWIGQGADSFYREMDSTLLPKVRRLAAALEAAGRSTTKIDQIMRQAEDDAAAIFRAHHPTVGQGAIAAVGPAGGGGGGSSGGGGGSAGGATAKPAPSIGQQPTLKEALAKGIELPAGALETMDIDRLMKMKEADRKAWYAKQLGPYENQIQESARNHGIPAPLLRTVILNELADIDKLDLAQEALPVSSGSLGIAQIQVDTAINDGLFGDLKDRSDVAERLKIPQYGIDAAAKEISILMQKASNNLDKPWQRKVEFTGLPGQPRDGNDWYSAIGGSTPLAREKNLARMISAAYNSPGILTSGDPSENRYPNARIHGDNAASLVDDQLIVGSVAK